MTRFNAGVSVGVAGVIVGAATVATSIAALELSGHSSVWSNAWVWVGVSLTALGLAFILMILLSNLFSRPETTPTADNLVKRDANRQSVADPVASEQLDGLPGYTAGLFEGSDLRERKEATEVGSLVKGLPTTPLAPSAGSTTPTTSAKSSVLRENERAIHQVLRVLHDAQETPDLLERYTVEVDMPTILDGKRVETETRERNTVTLAAYLYLIARMCRNTARDIVEDLHQAGWTRESQSVFLLAFENLVDRWTTYKSVLRDLQNARGGREPSFDHILRGLEKPRRAYIDALDAYHVQLQVVLNYL
jgi:hypothetical protein